MLRTEERPGAVVVTVGGEIDGWTAPQLRQELDTAQRQAGTLVVDLTAVTFLGSPGLRVLLDAAVDGAPLRVVVDHARPVVRPLEITGLDTVLATYDTVDDALRG